MRENDQRRDRKDRRVQVSDSTVVLNLTAPSLPKRQPLNMAVDNPAWIAGTSKTTYRDNSLRIGPEAHS